MRCAVRRWGLVFLAGIWLCRIAAPVFAQAAGERVDGWTDKYPWLGDFVWTVLGVGLLCLLVYFFRPGVAGTEAADFSIEVEGQEVTFKGRFPAGLEAMVEEFLVNDCRIEGAYEVMGKWEEGRLAVSVRGANAKPLEQRIRNFLKLNVKSAR